MSGRRFSNDFFEKSQELPDDQISIVFLPNLKDRGFAPTPIAFGAHSLRYIIAAPQKAEAKARAGCLITGPRSDLEGKR